MRSGTTHVAKCGEKSYVYCYQKCPDRQTGCEQLNRKVDRKQRTDQGTGLATEVERRINMLKANIADPMNKEAGEFAAGALSGYLKCLKLVNSVLYYKFKPRGAESGKVQ